MPRKLRYAEDDAGSRKVRLALVLEGLEFVAEQVEPPRAAAGVHDVPVLIDEDGTAHHEANGILRHLAARPGSRLLPEGRRDQALTWVLVERADAVLGPVVHGLVRHRDPDGNALGDDDLRVLSHRLEQELGVIEGLLERGPFVFGDHPTVVDVCFHAHLGRLSRLSGRAVPEVFLRAASWLDRLDRATAAGV